MKSLSAIKLSILRSIAVNIPEALEYNVLSRSQIKHLYTYITPGKGKIFFTLLLPAL